MPNLTQQSIKELLTALHKNITRLIDSYKKDGAKTKPSVEKFIGIIQKGILHDITNDIENASLNPLITIYDEYLERLKRIAQNAQKDGTGILIDDKDLLAFGKDLASNVSTVLASLKSEFLDSLENKQKTEQELDVREIKEQLGTLTKQLQETLTELRTTKENVHKLGQVFQMITVQADERTYGELESAFKQLQLPAPPKKLIEGASAAPASKLYLPFPELKEDKFAIEGFDPAFFEDKKQLITWKKKPTNLLAYEKLKLSQCVSANMYAAIIELGELLKKCTTNQYANFQSDSTLKTKIQAVLSNLIENWDKPWSFCKEQVITPALNGAPSLLESCLRSISTYKHGSDIVHTHLYPAKESKIQALLSVVYYKDPNEELHFLPKLKMATTNLELQLQQDNVATQQTRQVLTN